MEAVTALAHGVSPRAARELSGISRHHRARESNRIIIVPSLALHSFKEGREESRISTVGSWAGGHGQVVS